MTATKLRRHLDSHQDRERFKCTVEDCGETFRKQSTLDVHVAKVHEKIKPFVCAFLDDDGKACNSRFTSVYKLKDHEGRIHRTKRYTCSICSASAPEETTPDDGPNLVAFSTYSALNEHTASQHPPTCTECGLRCVTQTTLKAHMEVCHSGLSLGERKRFKCSEANCNAAFTKRGNLNLHVRTIHAERRFVCDIAAAKLAKGLEAWNGKDACGIALPAKSQMVEHIRTRHLGLSPGPLPRNRKARKSNRTATAIDVLVGDGEQDLPRSELGCPVEDCDWFFPDDYDLEQHLIATHNLSEEEVQSLPRDNDGTIELCQLRPSLSTGLPVVVSKADMEAERLFEELYEYRGGEDSAGCDDRFWIGGQDSLAVNSGGDISWLDEETEMRRLIDEEGG